jgi:hypothetical protein
MKHVSRSKTPLKLAAAAVACICIASSGFFWSSLVPLTVVLAISVTFGLLFVALIWIAVKISPPRGISTSTPMEDPGKIINLGNNRPGK